MRRVILESPYAGQVFENVTYARRCARDCARRGESVLASHLLYPQFLDDNDPEERALGIALGLAWRPLAEYSVFYTDRGWSRGMLAAYRSAFSEGHGVVLRALDGPVLKPPDEPDMPWCLLCQCYHHENAPHIEPSEMRAPST